MPLPGQPTTWMLQLDPVAAQVPASSRVMLDINNPATGIQVGGTSSGTGIDWGNSVFTQMMAQEGQWGSAPADFIVPNRTITIPLGLGMGGPGSPDANSALASLSQKVGLLQREGGWLLRQRSGAAALYADIVDAQLSDPDVWGETAGKEPGVVLTLTCLPDFYGDEVALDSIPCTGYCEAVLTSGGVTAAIAGDYPARTRINVECVNDGSSVMENFSWGIQSRYYDAAATAAPQYEAESLIVSSGASVVALTGASKGQVVERTTSGDLVQVRTGTGSFPYFTHQGTYQVLARACTTTGTPGSLYLSWGQAGTPDLTVNATAVIPTTGPFYFLNLGVINLQATPLGGVNWYGFIYGNVQAASNIALDEIILIPTSEYAGSVSALGSGYPDVLTLDSSGIYFAFSTQTATPIGSLGDLPRLPPSGIEGRPVRFVGVTTVDRVAGSDANLDQFTVTPHYRPCYLRRI